MKLSILSVAVVIAMFATTAFGATGKMTCRETGKTMDKCCCTVKAGKYTCKFTKKTYDKCCCDGMKK